MLSMHHDGRAQVLAALREVYDGSWTRHVGTDGGKTLHWEGKVGLIAGVTPTIDRHHAVMGSMGERFILFRLPEIDADEHARRALEHAGREREMRSELGQAVEDLFATGLAGPRGINPDERDRLIALATLVVRCRSAVERDGYSREIELIPEPEAPTRLAVVLQRLLAGLDAIGVDRNTAWSVVAKAALDSVPAIRLAALRVLQAADGPLTTNTVAEQIRYPVQTSRRALEDLTAHRLVLRTKQGKGQADTWTLTQWAAERLAATVPEKSDGAIKSLLCIGGDFSGKLPGAAA